MTGDAPLPPRRMCPRQTRRAFLQFFTSCVPPIFRSGGFDTANRPPGRRFRRSGVLGPLSVYAVSPSIEIERYTTCKNLQKTVFGLPPGGTDSGEGIAEAARQGFCASSRQQPSPWKPVSSKKRDVRRPSEPMRQRAGCWDIGVILG